MSTLRRLRRWPRLLVREIALIGRAVAIGWPSNGVGAWLRARYYRRLLGERLGPDPQFGIGAQIHDHPRLRIGARFAANTQVVVVPDISLGIRIGNDVSLAHGTYLRASNHRFDRVDIPIAAQGHAARRIATDDGEYSIVIEDDVWIGANAVILSGSHIRKGSIVAAGAVVAGAFPENAIIGGIPARLIRLRTEPGRSHDEILFDPN